MKRLTKLILATAAALVLGAASPAWATEGSCNTGRPSVNGNWQTGWAEYWPQSDGLKAISADIENYYPAFDASLTPYGTTQWVMLSGSGGSFIQLGWNQSGSLWNNHVQFMEAYNATTGQDTYQEHGIYMNQNTMINYQVNQDPNDHHTYHLYVNGSLFWTYTFSGANTMTSPVWAQIYAETQNEAEQVPGGYNQQDFVRNAILAVGNAGAPNLYGQVSGPSWAGTKPAKGSNADGWLNLWDAACDQ